MEDNKEKYVRETIYIDSDTSVEECVRNGVAGILIKGRKNHADCLLEIFLPDITDIEEVSDAINTGKKSAKQKEEEKKERRKELEERHALKEREKVELKEKQEKFLSSEYLEVKDNYPTFILDEHDQYATFMYIDENKGITIKSIDKNKMEAVSSTLDYPAIHYYEKAGTIHYVSKINVDYDNSSVAASFVPSKIKMTPVVIGTLLFGPMGMAAGAMIGYKGAHFEQNNNPQSTLHISSDAERIDDRSVILNYYSEKNKQYTDIELPHDIYNFLQTHLAEKKYDIVLENEKQTYTNVQTIGVVGEKQAAIGVNSVQISKTVMSLEDFEIAVKKLKLMFDNSLISEEEFNEKKKELMSNIL